MGAEQCKMLKGNRAKVLSTSLILFASLLIPVFVPDSATASPCEAGSVKATCKSPPFNLLPECKPCIAGATSKPPPSGTGGAPSNSPTAPNETPRTREPLEKTPNFQSEVLGEFTGAADQKEADVDLAKRMIPKFRKIEEENLEKARRRNEEIRAKAKAESERKKILNNQRIITAAEGAGKKGEHFPKENLNEIEDSEIKSSLRIVSIAQESVQDLKEEVKVSTLELAQLLQMAATAMKFSNSMNSVKEQGQMPTIAAKSEQEQMRRTISRKLASGGEISESSLEDRLGEAKQLEDQSELEPGITLSPEARAKLKAGIEAAAKRKKALSLKEKLRAKIDGKAKDTDSTEKLFSGDLIPDTSETAMVGSAGFGDSGSDGNSRPAGSRSYNESPVFQAMQAMQNNGFSMDSSQTEAEVSRILAEAKDELGNSDRMGGILELDSPSLFERVRSAHASCLSRKCLSSL
jgi:hypothetical protein